MPEDDRRGIYCDEIPMGRKVLYDLEKRWTFFPKGAGTDPDFQFSDAEWWRAPEGSWLVLYERSYENPNEVYRSHYRSTEREAMSDANVLCLAWGMKVAVARVNWLRDWH